MSLPIQIGRDTFLHQDIRFYQPTLRIGWITASFLLYFEVSSIKTVYLFVES